MHEVVNTGHNTGYEVLQCHFRYGGSDVCRRDPRTEAVPACMLFSGSGLA